MKKIVLFCAAGMSTSLLVTRMQEAADEQDKDYDVTAYSIDELVSAGKDADIILLGPQIRYAELKVKSTFPNKPVSWIDMKVYGRMDGRKALEDAEKAMEEFAAKKSAQ